MNILGEIQKLSIKFIWTCKRPLTAKTMLVKKNYVGVFTLPNFKIYYKYTIIKCFQKYNNQFKSLTLSQESYILIAEHIVKQEGKQVR